ncbi:uncharacterized protein [Eurosta solidaginis]|uniref:uncharacterized protein n=1 Tax=Eurosta solidaginis TaxID=178769 RepID=UPI0035305C57
MRRELFNIKHEKFPKMPTNFEHIKTMFTIEQMYKRFGVSRYKKEESEFNTDAVINTNFSYSLFASPTIVNCLRSITNLSDSRTYIADATFSVVPSSKQFKQLLINHIVSADHPTYLIKGFDSFKVEVMDYFKPFIRYFHSQWMKKVKPENFSVYGESIRKSSMAETFHSRLNISILKHGNFYKFLDTLCGLDEVKSNDYNKSRCGLTSISRRKRSSSANLDKFNKDRLKLLKNKKITIHEILLQFSNMKSIMVSNDFLNEIHTSDSESSDEDTAEILPEDESLKDYILCVICCLRERQLLFVPCKHFKVCNQCFQQMKNNAEEANADMKCPICRSVINDAFPIFY